jgi:hypothetical protein
MTFFVEGLSDHHEPETTVRRIGEYDSLDDAVSSSKRIIDVFLRGHFRPGMDAKALLTRYRDKGEHPYIFRDDDKTFNVAGFNHLHYASTRSADICSGKKK